MRPDWFAALDAALGAASASAAGAPTALVSLTLQPLTQNTPGDPRIEVRLTRATRTLVFLAADMFDSAGVHCLAASSIYKVAP
jgi:hypothetical protein